MTKPLDDNTRRRGKVRCPKCQSTNIAVEARGYFVIDYDRDDIVVLDSFYGRKFRWDDTSPAVCLNCKHGGIADDFGITVARIHAPGPVDNDNDNEDDDDDD